MESRFEQPTVQRIFVPTPGWPEKLSHEKVIHFDVLARIFDRNDEIYSAVSVPLRRAVAKRREPPMKVLIGAQEYRGLRFLRTISGRLGRFSVQMIHGSWRGGTRSAANLLRGHMHHGS